MAQKSMAGESGKYERHGITLPPSGHFLALARDIGEGQTLSIGSMFPQCPIIRRSFQEHGDVVALVVRTIKVQFLLVYCRGQSTFLLDCAILNHWHSG